MSQGSRSLRLSTTINGLGTIFPDRLFVPMRYRQRLALTITTGVPQGYTFAGNSVYDPDQTGAGHQAYGYDQLNAYYDNYRVSYSKIQGICIPTTTTSALIQGVTFGIRSTNTPALNLSDIDLWGEVGTGAMRSFNANGSTLKENQINLSMSFAKAFGITPQQLNIDRLFEGQSGDPSSVWYWQVIAFTSDLLSSTTVMVDIVITYSTLWTNLKQMGSS